MNDEELARIIAHILGPSSAAALALAELERRRAAGERVEIFNWKNRWIVGPPPGASRLADGARTPGDATKGES